MDVVNHLKMMRAACIMDPRNGKAIDNAIAEIEKLRAVMEEVITEINDAGAANMEASTEWIEERLSDALWGGDDG